MPAMYARKRHETLVTSSTDYNTNRALGMGSVEASYWGCMAQNPRSETCDSISSRLLCRQTRASRFM